MTKDPYSVLGVPRSATAAQIKTAYRKLAKRWHPDRNPDDRRAEERFAEIGGAYEILGDPDRRARFDRGEIDAGGRDRSGYSFGGGGAGGGFGPFGDDGFAGGWRFQSRSGTFPNSVDDILREFMGGGRANGRDVPDPDEDVWADSQQRGRDIELAVSVTLEDLVSEEKVRVVLPNGKKVDFRLPPGAVTGQQVRLRGQGDPSPTGSLAGDAIITLDVLQHPLFRREGTDLRVDVPVTLYDAVLGGKVRAPTLDGPVQLAVPTGTSGGKTLRLRGKGLPTRSGGRGDLLVTLRIALPDPPDDELVALMKRMRDKKPYQPR